MSIVSSIFAGGISGVLEGVGSLALKLREAITGKTVLSSEDQIKLLEIATEMDRLKLNIEATNIQGQLAINKAEAESGGFKSTWRPGAAWVCVAGFGYSILLKPLLPWVLTVAGIKGVPPLPDVDMGTITLMLGGLLGLGTMRTAERISSKV